MTRGRVTAEIEDAREQIEGDLAALGTVLVLVEMVFERVEMVFERVELARKTRQTSALEVCGDDLRKCEKLVHRVQIRIKKRYEEDLK